MEYTIRFCRRKPRGNGKSTFLNLECINENGEFKTFTYKKLLRLMISKKIKVFCEMESVRYQVWYEIDYDGQLFLRTSWDTNYMRYIDRIPERQ